MPELPIVKVCPKHGELREDGVIKAGKERSGAPKFRCKQCMKDLHRANYLKNKEKIAEKCKKYREENWDKVLALKRKWLRRPDVNEKQKVRHKAYRETHREQETKRRSDYYWWAKKTLAPYYVKKILTRDTLLRHKDIPDSLVETKRVLLKVRRIVGKKKHEKEDSEENNS